MIWDVRFYDSQSIRKGESTNAANLSNFCGKVMESRGASEAVESTLPECYLLLFNVSKKGNIGTLIRTAVAFNVKGVVVVGDYRREKVRTFGHQGTLAYMKYYHFSKLSEAVDWLKNEKKCLIYGVEIDESAESVCDEPFVGNTAFLMGNEGEGLHESHYQYCDKLVYIPQYGCGTASLNVATATGIILHRFASWARYKENSLHGAKFDVIEDKRVSRTQGIQFENQIEAEKERRRQRREEAEADGDLDCGNALFGDD